MVETHIYYQGHRERTEINVIRGQKWSVILGMLWLACHNPKIDWKIGKVKMTRCPKQCGKQQRLKQGKLGQQKQKKEVVREKKRREETEEEEETKKGEDNINK